MNRIAQASPTSTSTISQADEDLRRVTAAQIGPRRPGDWFTTAARAAHNIHCTNCRERDAASDAAAAENGESMRRRDRRQLGLNIVTPRAGVTK